MTDPDALIYGLGKRRARRQRGRVPGKVKMFKLELERCERENRDPSTSLFLMTHLAEIALGPSINLGPLMPRIGYRVKQICDVIIDKAMELE